MAEGTQASTAAKSTARNKYAVVFVGTAVVLLIAGVALQFSRPKSAFPDAAAAGNDPAGRSSTASGSKKAINAIARVNGKPVEYDELAEECVRRHGVDILENIINRKIIQQACEAQGIEVTEGEVNLEIVRIAKKFNLPVDSWMQMLEAERNLTPDQYKRDIIWPMLALRKLAKDDVKLTKDDLQKAFLRNYGPRVKARAIVFDNGRRAGEVWEKLRQNPEEFERLARTYSTDPASRPLGGSIPPIQKFGTSPALEEAAFKLKEGEISGVIQISLNQWVILLCEGQTEQIVTDIADVQDILKEELREQKVQTSVASTFEELKEKSNVLNHLTNTSKAGKPQTPDDVKQAADVTPTGTSRKRVDHAAGEAPAQAPRTATQPRTAAPAAR